MMSLLSSAVLHVVHGIACVVGGELVERPSVCENFRPYSAWKILDVLSISVTLGSSRKLPIGQEKEILRVCMCVFCVFPHIRRWKSLLLI